MSSDDEDVAPIVMVGGKPIPVTQVDNKIIAQMTPSEKEAYIQTYQECYSNLYDWSTLLLLLLMNSFVKKAYLFSTVSYKVLLQYQYYNIYS